MAVFTLNWSNADIDGDNTRDSSGDRVVVDVSTPRNRGASCSVNNFGDGVVGLPARNVADPTGVSLNFDDPVRNVAFEIFDAAASAGGWDDQITIVALDAAGNQVAVDFSDLAFHHQVSGNVLNTNDNVSVDVETLGAADSVTVNIVGPIVSLQVIYDNDGGPEDSGLVGLSDITFETFGPLVGYVEGTSGDATIDVAYTGDPEEDRVDGGDAILPGAAPQDDVILAGGGDDTIVAGAGGDLVIGSEGRDATIRRVTDGDRNTDFTQEINFAGASRMEVTLGGKAALENLDHTRASSTDDSDDTIIGGDSADLIYGQAGSDTIVGGTAGDVVFGGEDADGNDVDVLDLTGSDVDFITYEPGDPEAGTVTFLNGTTLTFSQIENVIPCFTPGTLIATPQGARRVENLTVGDRVQTRDNGIQTIVWAGRKAISHANLIIAPELRPVRIKAGALGSGFPVRDMLVSPNHRMLILSEMAALYFEESEVLVAAKHLTHRDGIDVVDVPGVIYVHFMFENHEVVLADGAWSESFQPGDYTLRGVGDAQRAEIFALFPELATPEGLTDYRAARRSLKRHEATLLV